MSGRLKQWACIGAAIFACAALSSGVALADAFLCTPDRIGVLPDRVYVECYFGRGDLYLFEVSTRDTAEATRALNLMSLAMLTGRRLSLVYDNVLPKNPVASCPQKECRIATGVGLGKP